MPDAVPPHCGSSASLPNRPVSCGLLTICFLVLGAGPARAADGDGPRGEPTESTAFITPELSLGLGNWGRAEAGGMVRYHFVQLGGVAVAGAKLPGTFTGAAGLLGMRFLGNSVGWDVCGAVGHRSYEGIGGSRDLGSKPQGSGSATFVGGRIGATVPVAFLEMGVWLLVENDLSRKDVVLTGPGGVSDTARIGDTHVAALFRIGAPFALN